MFSTHGWAGQGKLEITYLARPKGEKIAREKNNCHDLSIMAKKVGSNFFLKDQRLSADLNFPFAALASVRQLAESAAPNDFAISQMVRPEGFEPPTLRLRGGCSTKLSYGRLNSLF